MTLFALPYRERLLSLINQVNTVPVPLTEKNLYFGRPKAAVDGIHTDLPTVAMLGQEYDGYVTFQYKRLNLTTMFGDTIPFFADIGAPTLYGMLPSINKFLGLDLTRSDVVDQFMTVDVGEEASFTIQATPRSMGYTGSFVFRFFRLRPQLEDIVVHRQLPVLNFDLDPAIGRGSLQMATWGFDFTNDKATILVRKNYWANPAAVATLMAEYGFNNWPIPHVNGVEDYSTQNYPLANKAFDRVTIQRAVVVGNFQGDAYFHYNNLA